MSIGSSIPAHVLQLHTSAAGNATVVHCAGRLTTETAPLPKAEAKPLLRKGCQVVLDLSDLVQMDSSGLGTLVGLYISPKTAGCGLELVNLTPRIRELLSLANVLSIFEACGRSGARIP